jgi:gliding motility-associated-like protein
MYGIFSSLQGQISSKSADWGVRTSYLPADTIFVFYQYPSAKKGSVSVTNPFGSSASFTWNQYDTLSNTFGPALKTDLNVLNSTLDNLSEGGYKISITGTTRDTSFMAWVCFDDFSLAVEKDNAGNVRFGKYTCDYVDVAAKGSPKSPFVYEDPKTHAKQTIKNKLTYLWTADPAPELPFSIYKDSASMRVDHPPYKDTHYKVTVTDRFGLVKEDQVFYPSINPKAKFELKPDPVHVVDGKNSAPLQVTFTNQSENADTFIWYMGRKDTVYVKTPVNILPFTEPKTYYIRLIAQKNGLCVDSCKDSIQIAPPEIEMGDSLPNVFTPNGDNIHDFYKVYNISIKAFKITIFSRWGKKVYESPPVEMLLWEGWNGKVNGNGSDASPGIYYYVLEVLTWANDPDPKLIHTNGKYSGFFYLYR